MVEIKKSAVPRIVLFDLETLPNLKEVMKVFPSLGAYPGLTLKATINSVICFGWKVYGAKSVHCINAWDFKGWETNVNDDLELVKAGYEILTEADVVVTHNGKRFDWKFFQTRLIAHNLPPLPKMIHIDTCSESKKHLFPYNNKLDTLAKFMTDTGKQKHDGWSLWEKVLNRDSKAMAIMEKYCKQDVRVLEAIFTRLKPMIKGLPNENLFVPEVVCHNCGSMALQRRGKNIAINKVSQRYQCRDCGSWSSQTDRQKFPRSL